MSEGVVANLRAVIRADIADFKEKFSQEDNFLIVSIKRLGELPHSFKKTEESAASTGTGMDAPTQSFLIGMLR